MCFTKPVSYGVCVDQHCAYPPDTIKSVQINTVPIRQTPSSLNTLCSFGRISTAVTPDGGQSHTCPITERLPGKQPSTVARNTLTKWCAMWSYRLTVGGVNFGERSISSPRCNPQDPHCSRLARWFFALWRNWNIQMAVRIGVPRFEMLCVCRYTRDQVSGGWRFFRLSMRT
jgi:hypothetical protein